MRRACDKRLCILLKNEPPSLQCLGDITAVLQWNQDIIREVRCEEEYGAAKRLEPLVRLWSKKKSDSVDGDLPLASRDVATHTPANANGLVKSKTL